MKTVDLKTVLSWNPCKDFPHERVKSLFGGRETGTVADVFAVDMRQDEQLWCALREAFFTPQELETMGAYFVIHAAKGADLTNQKVVDALYNATMASVNNFEELPEDKRQERWKSGATEAEKCAALSALWAAQSRANAFTEEGKRFRAWNRERDWQVRHVKDKAGI